MCPKIRLSALATDIKGKSNGSVFSKNSGGTYFRTTQNGGGRKSQNWQIQKGKLSALAQSWKQLTDDEQTAWNEAVNEYPTLNAWGESRIPSGYELFMRLNGVLSSANKALLSVPVAPRSLPDMGEVELDFPENFQFCPTSVINLTGNSQLQYRARMVTNWAISEQTTLSPFAVSFRIVPKIYDTIYSSTAKFFSLFSIANSETFGIVAGISFVTKSERSLVIGLQDGEISVNFSAKISADVLNSPMNLAFSFDGDTNGEYKVFLNGAQLATTKTGEFPAEEKTITGDLTLGSISTFGYHWALWSDFRFFNSAITEENAKQIMQGYIVGNEFLTIPMTSFKPTKLELNTFDKCDAEGNCPDGMMCIDGECYDISVGETYLRGNGVTDQPVVIWGELNFSNILLPWSPGFVPDIKIKVENPSIDGTILQILATPPTSYGVNGNSGKWRTIGYYPYASTTEFPVSEAWKEQFKNLPVGSNITFKVILIDSYTGVANKVDKKPKKKTKPTRFKVGSELSGSVNFGGD